MIRQIKKRIAPRHAVALVLLFAAFCGCEKKPSPSVESEPEKEQATPTVPNVSRAQDSAYRKKLDDMQGDLRRLAAREAKVAAVLDHLREKARKKLGEKATDEQIEAELAAHPSEYPGYEALHARSVENEAAAKKKLEQARAVVRDRILQERADRAAATQKK